MKVLTCRMNFYVLQYFVWLHWAPITSFDKIIKISVSISLVVMEVEEILGFGKSWRLPCLSSSPIQSILYYIIHKFWHEDLGNTGIPAWGYLKNVTLKSEKSSGAKQSSTCEFQACWQVVRRYFRTWDIAQMLSSLHHSDNHLFVGSALLQALRGLSRVQRNS